MKESALPVSGFFHFKFNHATGIIAMKALFFWKVMTVPSSAKWTP